MLHTAKNFAGTLCRAEIPLLPPGIGHIPVVPGVEVVLAVVHTCHGVCGLAYGIVLEGEGAVVCVDGYEVVHAGLVEGDAAYCVGVVAEYLGIVSLRTEADGTEVGLLRQEAYLCSGGGVVVAHAVFVGSHVVHCHRHAAKVAVEVGGCFHVGEVEHAKVGQFRYRQGGFYLRRAYFVFLCRHVVGRDGHLVFGGSSGQRECLGKFHLVLSFAFDADGEALHAVDVYGHVVDFSVVLNGEFEVKHCVGLDKHRYLAVGGGGEYRGGEVGVESHKHVVARGLSGNVGNLYLYCERFAFDVFLNLVLVVEFVFLQGFAVYFDDVDCFVQLESRTCKIDS